MAREPVYCRLSLLGANCPFSRTSTLSWLETSKVGLKPQHSHAHCLYSRKTCKLAAEPSGTVLFVKSSYLSKQHLKNFFQLVKFTIYNEFLTV